MLAIAKYTVFMSVGASSQPHIQFPDAHSKESRDQQVRAKAYFQEIDPLMHWLCDEHLDCSPGEFASFSLHSTSLILCAEEMNYREDSDLVDDKREDKSRTRETRNSAHTDYRRDLYPFVLFS